MIIYYLLVHTQIEKIQKKNLCYINR